MIIYHQCLRMEVLDLEKLKVTITLKGREVEVVTAIAESSGKRKGDVVAEIVHEVLAGLIPAIDSQSESQAIRAVLRVGLNKLSGLLDESIG